MENVYDTSMTAFIVITVILGGAAAWMTGRAVARSWQSILKVVGYMALLALAVRFLHYALADGIAPAVLATDEAGTLVFYYLVDLAVLITIGAISYRIAKTGQMTAQYPWLYRRTSPFNWEAREPEK